MMGGHVHCCEYMRDIALADQDVPVSFDARFLEYGIEIVDGGSSFLRLRFCPWCGQPLPESLRMRWFEELEKLGINPEEGLIPEEFSDGRWIARSMTFDTSNHPEE